VLRILKTFLTLATFIALWFITPAFSQPIQNSLPYGTPGVAKTWGPRPGTQDTAFACNAKEILAAKRTIKLKNGMIAHNAKDNEYTFTIEGRFETPHTGFKHTLSLDKAKDERAYMTLSITQGSTSKNFAQVITPIFFNETLEFGQNKVEEVHITIKKDFNHGPSKIKCIGKK